MEQHHEVGENNHHHASASAAVEQHQQHQAQHQAHNDERFSKGVADLLMAVEELRGSLLHAQQQKVETYHVVQWQQEYEYILQILDALARWTDDDSCDNQLQRDLFRNCHMKATGVAEQMLEKSMQLIEIDEEDDDPNLLPPDVHIDVIRQDGQRAIARMVEINLLLHVNSQARFRKDANNNNGDNTNDTDDETNKIVQSYVSYQRQVLRQRAKPHIARLVQARRDGLITTDLDDTTAPILGGTAGSAGGNGSEHDNDDNDSDDSEEEPPPLYTQYHAPVVSSILGQAAALIHPLLSWKASLPPQEAQGEGQGEGQTTANNGPVDMVGLIRDLTSQSITTLDEQCETLIKTVSEWYWDDRPIIEMWMKQSAIVDSNHKQWLSRKQLGILDGLVEEIAFGCQVQARYRNLVQTTNASTSTKNNNIIENELLPEWTWKYAALERFLAMQQWHSAILHATPVTIVMGSDVQVPSVVEDAQYLSTRALERAASTQSNQAMGTVAHAISHDVWSTDAHGHEKRGGSNGISSSVYHALLERRGCWEEKKNNADHHDDSAGAAVEEPPKSTGFASALLDALDDDLGPDANVNAAAKTNNNNTATISSSNKKPKSAPTSGNFLANLVGVGGIGGSGKEQAHLDTEFCAMNGTNAACAACRTLVTFLDSLLLEDGSSSGGEAPPTSGGSSSNSSQQQGGNNNNNKATAMIQLAREELFRYAEAYEGMLKAHIQDSLESSCGSMSESIALPGLCFHDMYAFLRQENYNIDSNQMALSESDERLDRELIELLRHSRFLSLLSQKCETAVLQQIGEVIVDMVMQIFFNVLWKTPNKKVSDWGSLLLSKQVRLIQAYVNQILSAADTSDVAAPAAINLFAKWERLSQVLTVLQLEKPSDWLAYTNSVLSPEELHSTLSLRVDFSTDAIQAVVTQVSSKSAVAVAGSS